MDKKFFLLNVLGAFVGIMIGAILFLLLFTGCASNSAATIVPTTIVPAVITPTPLPAGTVPQKNIDRFWSGTPSFPDGTTSKACWESQIEYYYIYDPAIGTWTATVCKLSDGLYGIIYLSPIDPFKIESVTEYDSYLIAKGYEK
jgi:hypothetical protein